jgi:transposase
MPLRSDPVSMPGKKVTFKKGANGAVYVYRTLRAYRNKRGQPTSDEVAIGKKDPATGMLVPNRTYFELYHGKIAAGAIAPPGKTTPSSSACRAASYGNSYALMEVAQSIELRKILEKCFPDRWERILAAAFYMVCCGNVMMYIEDWFDETDVPFAEPMDDQECSHLFASISCGDRAGFFNEWTRLRSESEYIAYDVTSISTWSKGIDIAEWGHNRDDEKLPQVNLGMFYGAESCLPVFYHVYNGSVPDKCHLSFMMEHAGKHGITSARFVIDRGFVTEQNLKFLAGKKHLFVTAFPGNLLEYDRIIEERKSEVRKAANWIAAHRLYGLGIDAGMHGIDLKAHVYYDSEKQALDEKELYSCVERLEAELEKIGKSAGVSKKYSDFFSVVSRKSGEFSYRRDLDKIDERLGRAGYFILLSNDAGLDSGRALDIYRRKDVIEKSFDQLKNGLDFKRLRTHVNETTDGKLFVGFIALILRSCLLGRLKASPDTKTMVLEKALIELRKIRAITHEDSSRLLPPLTKRQKAVLKALAVSPENMAGTFA